MYGSGGFRGGGGQGDGGNLGVVRSQGGGGDLGGGGSRGWLGGESRGGGVTGGEGDILSPMFERHHCKMLAALFKTSLRIVSVSNPSV